MIKALRPPDPAPPQLEGWPVCDALLTEPHILTAGATGSGKSVLLNDIIYTITARKAPSVATFILIDPKRVDLVQWRDISHVRAYASTPPQILTALRVALDTMDARYKRMARRGQTMSPEGDIYIIIDELADLLINTSTRREALPLLMRLSALGRAARVRLIMATQAPNRRILSPELLLNVTHRLALRCVSPIESRQIIGQSGAEALPKYGRGLLLGPDGLQALPIPYTSPEKIASRVEYWTKYRY